MPPDASSKMRMKSSPIALRLSSGSVMPGEAFEEAVGGVDVDELDPLVTSERLDDLFALALPHQPGVDEHAGQLVTDRPVDERGRHGGVDTAGQPAQGPALPDLLADRTGRRVDEVLHRPRTRKAGGFVEESLHQLLSPGRVENLGVVLHAVDAPGRILERGGRRLGRMGRDDGARRRLGDRVEVAHPHLLVIGVGEQHAAGRDVEVGPAVLTSARLGHGAAEVTGEDLRPVTDAQDGDAEVVDALVDPGGAVLVHRLRATGEDQRRRPARCQVVGGDVVGDDLGEDVALADAPGDQLRVLRSEVDDEDRSVTRFRWLTHRRPPVATSSAFWNSFIDA